MAELTESMKKKLKEIKSDPRLQEDIKGLTDEEIIAKWRFNDGDGTGVKAYASEEEWRAARKKRNQDVIEEI